LTVNQSSTTTYAGVIETDVALTKEGSGTLTLTGTSDYTGGTIINGGMLKISGGSDSSGLGLIGASSGSTGTMTVDGAAVRLGSPM